MVVGVVGLERVNETRGGPQLGRRLLVNRLGLCGVGVDPVSSASFISGWWEGKEEGQRGCCGCCGLAWLLWLGLAACCLCN